MNLLRSKTIIFLCFILLTLSCSKEQNHNSENNISKKHNENKTVSTKNTADYSKKIIGNWQYETTITTISGKAYKTKVFPLWEMTFKKNGEYIQKILLANSKTVNVSKPGLKWHIKGNTLFRSKNLKVQIYKLDDKQLILSPISSSRIIFTKNE